MPLTLHYDFERDKSLVARVGPTLTCTRTGTDATRVNASGQIETVAANTARFDHTLNGGVSLGLLVEIAHTNICLHSGDISNAAWVASNVTKGTTSVTDPTGSANTNVRLTASAGNGTLLQTITSAVDDYSYAVYMKRVTGTGNIDLTCDNGGTWTTKTLTSSWTRFDVTANTTNPVVGVRIVTSGDEIDFWGSDCLKDRVTPLSHVQTAGASATCNNDDVNVADITFLDTAATAVGTLCCLASKPYLGSGVAGRVINIDDGSNTDRVRIQTDPSDVVTIKSNNSGGDNGSSGSVAIPSAETRFRFAGAYANDDFIGSLNGTLDTKDTAAAFPLSDDMTTLRVGSNFGPAAFWDGHIQEVRYYNERLDDQLVIQLSNGIFPKEDLIESPIMHTVSGHPSVSPNERFEYS